MKRRVKEGGEAETQLKLSTFPFYLFRVILKTHPKDFNIAMSLISKIFGSIINSELNCMLAIFICITDNKIH